MFGPTLILLLASIGLGLTYILNKKLSLTKFHSATYMLVLSVMGTFLSVPLLLFQPTIPSSWVFWPLAIISATAFGIGMFFGFRAFKLTDASVVSLVHNLDIAFVAIIGITLYSETYSFISYLGLLLIMASAALLLYDGKKIRVDQGFIFAFLLAIGSTISSVADKKLLEVFSPFTYAFINNGLISLLFLGHKTARQEAIKLFKSNTRLLALISFINVGAWVTFLFVLQSTNVSKTLPIFKSLTLIIPVVLGILILKEKQKLWQKLVGMTLGAIGILLLK